MKFWTEMRRQDPQVYRVCKAGVRAAIVTCIGVVSAAAAWDVWKGDYNSAIGLTLALASGIAGGYLGGRWDGEHHAERMGR